MTLRIYMRHVRAARLDGKPVTCAPGVRAWAKQHNVDMHALAHEGVPIEQADALNDAFAQRVAAIARAEAAVPHAVTVVNSIDVVNAADSAQGAETIVNIINAGRGNG